MHFKPYSGVYSSLVERYSISKVINPAQIDYKIDSVIPIGIFAVCLTFYHLNTSELAQRKNLILSHSC